MRPRSPAGLVALIVAAVIAAACGSSVDVAVPDAAEATATPVPTPQDSTPRPTPTPVPDPPGRAELPEDLELEIGPRIAVQTADGQLITMLGDGTNVVPLTDPDEGRRNVVPRWSTDGNRLAWVAIDEDDELVSVRSARFDGSAWGDVELRQAPFHLQWDPSGRRIAALSPGGGVFDLGVIDVDGEDGYRRVDAGAPYWFAWNPDGDGFLVNASGLRLDFVPVEGPSQVLEQNPGLFQAPSWLTGAVQLVYADREGDDQFLVVSGAEGTGRRALITYDGYLQFAVSEESGWVALQVVDPSLAPVPDVITASYAQPSQFIDDIDPIPRNELTIIALFGGDPFVLYPPPGEFQVRPVVGFWWSPDGGSLAWLLQTDPGDGDCASETAQYQWQFWTTNDFVEGPRFNPTATFACEYLPGFDQVGESASFWSPDGAILTYAGTNPFTGERGIWNYEVGSFLEPQLISDGEIAVWSPDTAGSAASSSL